MKVTVDTRHDSLNEALATVRAAFGTSGDASNNGDRPNTTPDVARAKVSSANGDSAAAVPSAAPVANRTPAKRTNRAARPSSRNRITPRSMEATSTVGPAGRAEAIRSWAKSQGMEVKQAGRLPAAVIQAYQESSQH